MSNPVKYIKNLEAVGFKRNQAEAQVQMVMDALEGDLVTKNDFAIYQEKLENRFGQIDHRFTQIDLRFNHVDHQFMQMREYVSSQIKDSELRLTTRLGFLFISANSLAVAVLSWIIKLH